MDLKRTLPILRVLLISCLGLGLMWQGMFASCAPTTAPEGTTKDGGTGDNTTQTDQAPPADRSQPKDDSTPAEPQNDGGTAEPVGDSGTPDVSTTPDSDTSDQGTPDKSKTNGAVWYGQVQSIIQQNCQVCHQAGGVGPFALTTYEEVKAKASIVEWSVANKRMPPWMPSSDSTCEPFKHAINLSQSDIDAISDWAKNGTPAGDPKNATTYQPKTDKLDHVDAEVDIQVDYTPPGTTPDDYHCFLTKPVLTTSKELTGFQLVPGVREMVHHVLIYSVTESKAKQLQTKHNSTHWSCGTGALFGGGSKLIGVWVPGTDVVRFPQDTGMSMSANEQLVLEFHYNLASLKEPKADRTKIRLQYARQPVKHKLRLQLQVQFAISLPPKSKGVEVKHTLSVPSPVRVWGLMPHMHKQGTKFSLKVENPGENKACMLDIPRWDYNWQQTFFFNKPGGLLLKGGEKIHMKCTFDNPTDKNIGWGDRTGDEMCLNFYFVSAP